MATRTIWQSGIEHPAIIDVVISNGPCARVATTHEGTQPCHEGGTIVVDDEGNVTVEDKQPL